jgi:hypothetical protein
MVKRYPKSVGEVYLIKATHQTPVYKDNNFLPLPQSPNLLEWHYLFYVARAQIQSS